MIADASRSLAGTMRACDCGNSTIGPMPSASSRSASDFQRQGSKATSRTAKRWASRRTASVGPQRAVVPLEDLDGRDPEQFSRSSDIGRPEAGFP